MKLGSLRDVFVENVRDLYNAETQLLKALPRMAKAASNADLKAAFTEHVEQTRGQVERLDKICESLGIKAKGKTCAAMKGLIEEGSEILGVDGAPAAKDAALIAAAQRIEHYEMAGYGCARTFATLLGEQEAAELLGETLEEETAADKKLTAVAESGLNEEAAAGEDGEASEEAAEEPAPKKAPRAKAAAAKAPAKKTAKRG